MWIPRCFEGKDKSTNMLQSFSPSRCWDYESEPLLFDDEFCQILKDLNSMPTPPQSPPMKSDLDRPLSKVDQLTIVSELLLEEQDFLELDCDALLRKDGRSDAYSYNKDQRPEVSDDCLWYCLGDRFAEEKLSAELSSELSSVLSGPLLSDIDTSIFQEIAGSTLDCHGAALLPYQDEDFSPSSQQNESSDASSLSAASDSSASDSEDEIDVVTVKRRGQPAAHHRGETPRQSRPPAKRSHTEIPEHDIHLQHNYAAPHPASPRRDGPSHSKRSRGDPHHRSRQRAASPGDSGEGGVGGEEEERRRTHNVMERQRREELKNCFLRLRDNVPELSRNSKASKVQILKKARDGIRGLEEAGQRLAAERERLSRRQEKLEARLQRLRR